MTTFVYNVPQNAKEQSPPGSSEPQPPQHLIAYVIILLRWPMAKGRKDATDRNRHHLLLGTTHGHDHGGRNVGPEFDHDDVWPTANEPNRTDDEEENSVRRQLGGLSLSFESGWRHQRRREGTSAPVDVPSWSGSARAGPASSAEDETEWVPPHEYLAREHGRRSVTTSVFEGAGRTLKGRDMSRVRDAVWRQTGFFG
ncbi:putative eukaryotic translation initiation factor 4B1 [Iris pallida]|uniref:Eukaryotic translation initiation factor 4B1 n=1 Tax=Iris pallida TaxID=29817 RepID=A0AAX6DHG1_IRIPA|nr:putative eukaryotic translation initiation factor 4B1 [Iris pallida]